MNRQHSLRMHALAVATVLGLAAGAANAADRIDLHRQDIQRLNAQYKAANLGGATMAHERHAQLLRLDPESRLVLMTRNSDHGVRNTRYQQTFRGVPIFGEQVIVSEDGNGNVRALFGRKADGLASELPSTRRQAGQRAGPGHRQARRAWAAALLPWSTRNEKSRTE